MKVFLSSSLVNKLPVTIGCIEFFILFSCHRIITNKELHVMFVQYYVCIGGWTTHEWYRHNCITFNRKEFHYEVKKELIWQCDIYSLLIRQWTEGDGRGRRGGRGRKGAGLNVLVSFTQWQCHLPAQSYTSAQEIAASVKYVFGCIHNSHSDTNGAYHAWSRFFNDGRFPEQTIQTWFSWCWAAPSYVWPLNFQQPSSLRLLYVSSLRIY